MHEALQLREKVMKTINDIKGYKKGQRALYKSYYDARDELDKFLSNNQLSTDRDLLNELCHIDTSEIFYSKKH